MNFFYFQKEMNEKEQGKHLFWEMEIIFVNKYNIFNCLQMIQRIFPIPKQIVLESSKTFRRWQHFQFLNFHPCFLPFSNATYLQSRESINNDHRSVQILQYYRNSAYWSNQNHSNYNLQFFTPSSNVIMWLKV